MTDLRRRTALGMLGSGMAFLAGCSNTSDGTADGNGSADGGASSDSVDGDLPSYASILPTNDRSSYFYGAIDVETMNTLLQDEGAKSGQEPTDPLVGNPVVVALLAAFGLRLLGSSAGFDAYSDNNQTANGEEQFVYAEGVYAHVGSYDRHAITADLEDAGYTLESEGEAYAVYAADSGEVVGVTDDVYAYSYPNGSDSAFDPLAAVERTVATAVGDRQPKHEADDDFERLLRAGENGGIACCLYTAADRFASETLSDDQASDSEGLQFTFDPFAGARGVHQQLAVSGSGSATANAVVTYNSSDLVDRARLESSLGGDADADSLAFERDGSRISIGAEYGGSFATE